MVLPASYSFTSAVLFPMLRPLFFVLLRLSLWTTRLKIAIKEQLLLGWSRMAHGTTTVLASAELMATPSSLTAPSPSGVRLGIRTQTGAL
jgi:hypothetical protein